MTNTFCITFFDNLYATVTKSNTELNSMIIPIISNKILQIKSLLITKTIIIIFPTLFNGSFVARYPHLYSF